MPATNPFHTKICGVRLKSDIAAVEASAADAIGVNFFPRSIRFLSPEDPATGELCRLGQAGGLVTVGVFVNESAERIFEIADRLRLDHVQLHGDESPDLARDLVRGEIRVIRAVKLPPGPITPAELRDKLAPWADLGVHLLLDADAGAAQGGSGRCLDWPGIGRWAASYPEATWTLAGGLTAENVREAIRLSGARSVDVASGVERPRGKKSAGLIEKFAHLASVR